MFWGLIMEPMKKYSQVVSKPFHISMAALDLSSDGGDIPVQVMCVYEERKYLLCTLVKDKVIQCPLDLNFDVGTEVSFVSNGKTHVHLTGYLVQDEEDMFDLEEEEEDEADVSLGNISASNILASGKRSKSGKAEGQLNGLSAKINKKLAALSKEAPPSKKLKTMDLLDDIHDEETDEEDADVSLTDLVESDDEDAEMEEDDDEDAELEEEDDDDGEEEEASDEEDEDDEVDDGEDVEESDVERKVINIQNGSAKKSKKAQETEKPKKKVKEEQKLQKAGNAKEKKTIEGGVHIDDIRVGNGAVAKTGKNVQVYYEGRFKTSNKVFDSHSKGAGFRFRLGRGEVIKGWDVGVVGMKVGGKRRITCPPQMAYGTKGHPPTIPPNSTLLFEVELKNVH